MSRRDMPAERRPLSCAAQVATVTFIKTGGVSRSRRLIALPGANTDTAKESISWKRMIMQLQHPFLSSWTTR